MMVPKKDAKKKKPQADTDDDSRWKYEAADQMSALIEKLRALPRCDLESSAEAGEPTQYVLAADLDAAIAASIENSSNLTDETTD